jgi:hypothetical protein
MESAMKTTVPFQGFYETIHYAHFENLIEDEIEFDTKELQVKLAKDFAKFVANEHNIDLTFVDLYSPSEYNFSSDVITADIPLQQVKELVKEVGETLNEVARELFTSRSGFISFYSPDVEDWGDPDTWDEHQVGCLLQALLVFRDDIDIDFRHYETFTF